MTKSILKLTVGTKNLRRKAPPRSDDVPHASHNDSSDITVLNNNALCGNLAGHHFLSLNKPRTKHLEGNAENCAAITQVIFV